MFCEKYRRRDTRRGCLADRLGKQSPAISQRKTNLQGKKHKKREENGITGNIMYNIETGNSANQY